MKRSTARWTTAFAAAALIGVPAAGWSQTPPAPTSQPPAAQQPAGAPAQHGAAEHVQKAKAALNDIPTSTLPARAKSRVEELKRHLNSLENSAAASHAADTAAKPSSKAKDTWAKDVAAIDKTLTELLGPATASGAAAPPAATGTTGQSKPETLTIDDTTKAKLLEVRQHVTAFATSMSGTGSSSPSAPSSEPSPEPAAAAAAQAQASSPAPTAESTPAASASASAPSAQSAAAAQSPTASSAAPAEQTQAQAQAPTANASSQDEEGAKRHLTAARDSLAQLTQLPAAAQLTGDTRTQVSQLIGNFNELITAKSDWRASYDKVAANVMAIIGADAAPPEAAPAAPTGTPGAVGTSGSTAAALDPAIKGKLVEFRTHLMAFEKAAGDAPSGPSSPSSSAMTPSSSAPTASSTPASSAPPSASPSSPSPEPAASSSPAEQGAAAAQSAGKMSQDNPISHIEAIEAIIGSGSKLTLEQAQVEQIRMHLTQLRKAVEKK